MNVYATSTDLAAWTGSSAPANADHLLRSASVLVAKAAGRDPYTDLPTGTTATALRDATTAQAAAWAGLGIDPAVGGITADAPVKRSSLGSGTVERDTSLQAQQLAQAVEQLVPEARAILLAAGLLLLDLPYSTSPTDGLLDYGLGRSRVLLAQSSETWPFF